MYVCMYVCQLRCVELLLRTLIVFPVVIRIDVVIIWADIEPFVMVSSVVSTVVIGIGVVAGIHE